MCGIAGVLHLDGSPVAASTVARMGAAIAHRGPDADGCWNDGPVGLAARRLAIIDPSPAGHQPMANDDGSLLLCYNGELYNFAALRMELEAKGHRFRSRSDTEVVVHAFQEWGQECLIRFNGHFAFAIWDIPRQRLFLARDRFGVKPLYYSLDSRRLLFGSEIKALLACSDAKPGICYSALDQYFTFQNVLDDKTLFEGIRLLPAGCSLAVDVPRRAQPRPQRYWDYEFSDQPLGASRDEAAEELYRLFAQAVTRQLVSDVPVACYLSGGMDSGSITAIARQHLGRLATFTMGFDLSSASGLELGFDERAHAEALSNILKTEHYEMVLHAGDMEQVMPQLVWHLEDLRLGQCYPNYYVARLASKFAKVVLSGAGGDELFGGYPWRYYRDHDAPSVADFQRKYYEFWQRLVPDEEKRDLFNAQVGRHVDGGDSFEAFREVLSPAPVSVDSVAGAVNQSLYFELKTFLHGLFIVEDKVSMAHSLETRMPFMDNDLVDFALRVPPEYKLGNLNRNVPVMDEDQFGKRIRYEAQHSDGKMVLRSAMARVLPPDVVGRIKQGFSAPDATWFRGESIDYVNDLLRNRRARIYEFLNPDYVAKKLDEHVSGKVNRRLLIWSLLSFEWWCRDFLEG